MHEIKGTALGAQTCNNDITESNKVNTKPIQPRLYPCKCVCKRAKMGLIEYNPRMSLCVHPWGWEVMAKVALKVIE